MDNENQQLNEEIKMALLKVPASRSYDDLLLLKSYITKTEFITKNLAGVVNPKQMNDICRSMSLEAYSIGDVVFNQGDIGDKVYVLLSGSCEVRVKYKIDLTQGQSEIREKLIVTYHSGQFFGERALQFDEPRSGTVVCTSFTDLVTITKATYVAVLNDARKEAAAAPSKDQLGTKESVINILSKIREKRTNQELDAVAAYLWRRIPFFQKFTTEQLVELCRVAETVSIWGRSMLFKQGQSGQAFYVILTGTVEVWVQSDNSAASNVPKPHAKLNDLTEGLGNKVNQLVSGDVFGERALENDTSQRMASIVTCEDKTELLVIAKEDYHNLVYVMMHIDSMSRLSLLRKTEIFRSVDVVHLKVLARFMEPRKYNRDEPLFSAGRKAIEMIIIEKGECRAETVIREGYEKMTEEEKRAFHEHHYMQQTHQHHLPTQHQNEYHHYEMQDFSLSDSKQSKPAARRDPTAHNYHSELDIRQDSNHIPGVRKGEARLAFPSITISHGATKKGHEEDTTSSTESASLFRRPPMKRFDTTDLIPLGALKTINLGRIAPNSVLATYITQCETIHNEVFHPETVIASSLVTAYTIGKHDFFNHMPKDTRAALVKIVAEFKTPMLSSLWENVPRVLDESQWKKSKTWEIYRQNVADDKKDANILQTYGNLSKMHISASSGNNSQSRINQKNELLMHNRELSNMTSNRTEVSLDWGLPKGEVDIIAAPEAFVPISASSGVQSYTKVPFGHAPLGNGNPPSSPASSQLNVRPMTTFHEMSLTIPENDFNITPTPGHGSSSKRGVTPHSPMRNRHNSIDSAPIEAPSLITSAVSKMIRNRINYSHYTDRLQQSISGQPSPNIGALDVMSPKNNANMGSVLSPSAVATRSLASTHTSVVSMPFFLIQIHRESSRNAGALNMLHNNSRGVRCYLRLCGSAPSCANVKEFADIQMENIYLTLFKSDAGREKELLLRWVPFKGFDSVPVNDSDHFIIYCRSTPIEYASINPSKNLFNAPFPAMCKQKGQRYSCIVANILVDYAAIQLQRMQQKKEEAASNHKHHHRHHHRHRSARALEEEDEDDDDSGDENHRRSHSKQKHSSARKNKVSIVTSTSNPNLDSTGTPGSIVTTNLSASSSVTVAPFSPLTQHQSLEGLKIPVVASGVASIGVSLPSENSNNGTSTVFAAKKSTIPPIPYMAEFSVLNEVLVTTSNRLDAIRYAIQRFGSFVDPSKTPTPTASSVAMTDGVTSPSHHALSQQNNPSNHVVGGGMGQKIYLRRPNTSSAHHLVNVLPEANSTFAPPTGIAIITSDRVLELANHDNKRICIVPLFKWILVNDDTLKTFDFTNAFSDEANKQQMQLDETSSLLLGSEDGDDYTRKSHLSGKGKLLHSFAEAGLLNGDSTLVEDDNDSPRSDTDDRLALKQQHIAKSLQILERDLQTKELSKKILQQSQSAQELQPLASATKRKTNQSNITYSLTDTLAEHKPGSPRILREGVSSLSGGPPLHSAAAAATTGESIKLEARLKNMNDSSAARSQFIAMSSRLSEEEHKMASRNQAAASKNNKHSRSSPLMSTLPAVEPSPSSTGEARQLVQIAERIDLALSIRNLNFVKVPGESAAGVMVPTDNRRASNLSSKQRSSTVLGGMSTSSRDMSVQSTPAVAGSVGKRISENIRLLSESMASKL